LSFAKYGADSWPARFVLEQRLPLFPSGHGFSHAENRDVPCSALATEGFDILLMIAASCRILFTAAAETALPFRLGDTTEVVP